MSRIAERRMMGMSELRTNSRTGRIARATVAALAVLAIAAAGCTGNGEADPVTPEPPEPEQATPPPSDDEPESQPSETAEPPEGEGRATVVVYFPIDGQGDPCTDVAEVSREVSAEDPIGESLYALLAGPTEAERAEGYGGWFSDETAGMINGYRSDNGIFYVDFKDFSSVIPNASTSCGSALLFAQLNTTLEQFPDIGEPRYSFDGDVAAFYEWLQMSPPEGS